MIHSWWTKLWSNSINEKTLPFTVKHIANYSRPNTLKIILAQFGYNGCGYCSSCRCRSCTRCWGWSRRVFDSDWFGYVVQGCEWRNINQYAKTLFDWTVKYFFIIFIQLLVLSMMFYRTYLNINQFSTGLGFLISLLCPWRTKASSES